MSMLGSALEALGFAPASDISFDWLFSYPDARPLLHAIATNFTPVDCVLTATEARSYAQLCSSETTLLPSSDAVMAARPLMESPLLPPNPTAAEAIALRKRLANINAQVQLLEDNLRAREPDNISNNAIPHYDERVQYSEDICKFEEFEHGDGHSDDSSATLNVIFALRDELDKLRQTLREHFSGNNGIFSDSNETVLTYVDVEQREARALATIIDNISRSRSGSVPHELLQHDELVRTTLNCYAELRGRLYVEQAKLIRAEKIIASLSSPDDSRYIELGDTVSMEALTAELRARTETSLAEAAQSVAHRAKKVMNDRVYSDALAQSLERHAEHIESLEKVVVALVEQRLRILCIQTSQNRQTETYHELFDALQLLLSLGDASSAIAQSSSNVKQEPLIENLVMSPSVKVSSKFQNEIRPIEVQEESSYRKVQEIANEEITKEITNNSDELEETIFQENLHHASSILQGFRKRIGAERDWLDVDTSPSIAALIDQLENDIASNTVVLETLLRNRDRIQQGAMPANSPKHNWIKQVNRLLPNNVM